MEEPTPDRSFVDQLRRIDKSLGIRFNGDHFVITYQVPDGGPRVNIWKVVAERGGFRQPDRRDLEMIQMSNIERESPEDKQARIARYMDAEREKDRRRAREDLRNMTRDNRIQLVRGFEVLEGGTWSGPKTEPNPAFRRITPVGHGN